MSALVIHEDFSPRLSQARVRKQTVKIKYLHNLIKTLKYLLENIEECLMKYSEFPITAHMTLTEYLLLGYKNGI